MIYGVMTLKHYETIRNEIVKQQKEILFTKAGCSCNHKQNQKKS